MDRQSDILLESGTNELGVMEFTIGGEIFGINVAKVLEIMMACPVVPMQKDQKDIEGTSTIPESRAGYLYHHPVQ